MNAFIFSFNDNECVFWSEIGEKRDIVSRALEGVECRELKVKAHNVNKKMVKIFIDEILYIESLKDYSRIVTKNESLVTRGQIGEMEKLFSEYLFLRIHRSYIVALDKIKAYSASEVEIDGKVFPIGRSYKEWIAKTLSEYYKI